MTSEQRDLNSVSIRLRSIQGYCHWMSLTFLGMSILMLFFLPEYEEWVPVSLMPLVRLAAISSGAVLMILIPGMIYGLAAFICDLILDRIEKSPQEKSKTGRPAIREYLDISGQ